MKQSWKFGQFGTILDVHTEEAMNCAYHWCNDFPSACVRIEPFVAAYTAGSLDPSVELINATLWFHATFLR